MDPAWRDGVRTPRQGRSRQSFEGIVEATIDLCRQRSFDQLTLAEICQHAGVSTGALYGRVAGKDELLRTVQVQFLARLGEQFSDEAQRIAARSHGLADVVPAVVKGLGKLLQENASVLRPFMLRSGADEIIAAAGRKSALENHAKFSRLLEACRSEILHPDPGRAIEAGMALIYASQARFLGLDSVGGVGDASRWNDMLEDLGAMMLAYLRFVPLRQ